MNGAAEQVGGIAVSTPPKPAPKPAPKPLAKPVLQPIATKPTLPSSPPSGLTAPIPSPKPGVTSKPKQAPVVSPKPKPGSVPVAHKPKTAASPVSSKPKPAGTKPETPTNSPAASPSSVSTPGVPNGDTPSLVTLRNSKPRPQIKRKSWLASPQQSFDNSVNQERTTPGTVLESIGTTDVSKEIPSAPFRGDDITIEPQSESVPAVEAKIPFEKPHNSADPPRVTSEIPITSRETDVVYVLECEDTTDEKGISEVNSGHFLNKTTEALKGVSESIDTSVDNPSEVLQELIEVPYTRDSVQKEALSVPADSVQISSVIPEVSEEVPNTTSGEEISPGPNNKSTPPELSESTLVKGGIAVDVQPPSLPESPQNNQQTPPVPAPRTSISSVSSVTSSLDSYDFLHKSTGSFKSHRSSHSVRSQASSRLCSDSEDECGVFEIPLDVVEEDQKEDQQREIVGGELLAIEERQPEESDTFASREVGSLDNLSREDKPLFSIVSVEADIETRKEGSKLGGVIAIDHESVLLVSVKENNSDTSLEEDKATGSQADSILEERSGHVSEEKLNQPADELGETKTGEVLGQTKEPRAEKQTGKDIHVSSIEVSEFVDEPLYQNIPALERQRKHSHDSDTKLKFETTESREHLLSESDVNVIAEGAASGKDSVPVDKSVVQGNQLKTGLVITEDGSASEGSESQENSGGNESSSDLEENKEEEDEMGKRVFSLSRKKKGMMKYSPEEFHEEYGASAGKTKSSSGNTKDKESKKKNKKGKKDSDSRKDKGASDAMMKIDLRTNAEDDDSYSGEMNNTDRPSKPPRMLPEATPAELEVGRSSTSDALVNPKVDGDVEAQKTPLPAPRLSLSRQSKAEDSLDVSDTNVPVPQPRKSIGREGSIDNDHGNGKNVDVQRTVVTNPQNKVDHSGGVTEDIDDLKHTIHGGGAGAVVTRVDDDGEEEVFIGAMPSSSTQTAFADQLSIHSSSAGASMVDESVSLAAIPQADGARQFRHYATIEPVGQPVQARCSPATEFSADSVTTTQAYADTVTTTTSENQSVTISFAGSEPLSESAEFLSRSSERALAKPWSEVATVTVSVTKMPEPLIPEFTHLSADSSAASSSSSLLADSREQAENNVDTGACVNVPIPTPGEAMRNDDDDGDGDDDDEDDDVNAEDGNMYDKVKIYDDSYKKKDWKYRESKEELESITQPEPENDEEADEAKDSVSNLSEARSSISTTASEQEFRLSFGSRPHRIQRSRGSEEFVRLSRISRERTISLMRQDGTFGLRIQKSKPVVVTSLDPDGPAEKSGLRVGDMILSVNGEDVRQSRHSEVVKLATEGPEPLILVVGTVVCNSLNIRDDKMVITGYMHKLAGSGMIKNWRRRWFVLKHDNCLYYYKTETDVLPQGAIVLRNYSVTKARDVGKQFSFKLTKVGARTYYFYTSNEEEMSSWGKAINEAANPKHTSDIWLDISTHNVSLPALSITDPECHGFLTKLNGQMRNPKRRYCIIKDACLYYYKDMNALNAQGVVHLHGYSIQETKIKGKKFAFILKPPSSDLREFNFCADHETDRKRWVSALAASIGRWIQTNASEDADDDGTEMLI